MGNMKHIAIWTTRPPVGSENSLVFQQEKIYPSRESARHATRADIWASSTLQSSAPLMPSRQDVAPSCSHRYIQDGAVAAANHRQVTTQINTVQNTSGLKFRARTMSSHLTISGTSMNLPKIAIPFAIEGTYSMVRCMTRIWYAERILTNSVPSQVPTKLLSVRVK